MIVWHTKSKQVQSSTCNQPASCLDLKCLDSCQLQMFTVLDLNFGAKIIYYFLKNMVGVIQIVQIHMYMMWILDVNWRISPIDLYVQSFEIVRQKYFSIKWQEMSLKTNNWCSNVCNLWKETFLNDILDKKAYMQMLGSVIEKFVTVSDTNDNKWIRNQAFYRDILPTFSSSYRCHDISTMFSSQLHNAINFMNSTGNIIMEVII